MIDHGKSKRRKGNKIIKILVHLTCKQNGGVEREKEKQMKNNETPRTLAFRISLKIFERRATPIPYKMPIIENY